MGTIGVTYQQLTPGKDHIRTKDHGDRLFLAATKLVRDPDMINVWLEGIDYTIPYRATHTFAKVVPSRTNAPIKDASLRWS